MSAWTGKARPDKTGLHWTDWVSGQERQERPGGGQERPAQDGIGQQSKGNGTAVASISSNMGASRGDQLQPEQPASPGRYGRSDPGLAQAQQPGPERTGQDSQEEPRLRTSIVRVWNRRLCACC